MSAPLPTLCAPEKCTACTACANSCAHHAIEMREDVHGFLRPVVLPERCVGCGLCERACPELNDTLTKYAEPNVYRCWLRDAALRSESTSGGAAYAFAVSMIQRGGHVWGAAFDAYMQPVYIEADTLDDLRPIRKSKYVQCALGDCFLRIREELQRGEWVLFCGTSCHVKGLRAFLRKDYDTLLTLDLVCHGVPSQGVWRKYKTWLEARYADRLMGFQFRPKRADGQEVGYYTLATFEKRGEVKIQREENGYFVGFQHNIFLRPCCHQCTGNGLRRYADVTVADFWGLGKERPFPDYKQRPRGISMVALNSQRARTFFEHVKGQLDIEPRSAHEATCSNHPYLHFSMPSPRAVAFFEEWQERSWDELTQKYFQLNLKKKVVYFIQKFLPPSLYYMLNYWRNG